MINLPSHPQSHLTPIRVRISELKQKLNFLVSYVQTQGFFIHEDTYQLKHISFHTVFIQEYVLRGNI